VVTFQKICYLKTSYWIDWNTIQLHFQQIILMISTIFKRIIESLTLIKKISVGLDLKAKYNGLLFGWLICFHFSGLLVLPTPLSRMETTTPSPFSKHSNQMDLVPFFRHQSMAQTAFSKMALKNQRRNFGCLWDLYLFPTFQWLKSIPSFQNLIRL